MNMPELGGQFPKQKKKNQSELSKLRGSSNRIKYLGWNNGIIAQHCAERKFEVGQLIVIRRFRTKTRKNAELGLRYCLKCERVYEIATPSGSVGRKPELHFYKYGISLDKPRIDCPKHNGEAKDYKVYDE